MSEVKNLLEELIKIQTADAWHGPGMQKILEGITADQARKRPVAGLHSIWELVLHIAAWENVFCDRLENQDVSEPKEGDFPPVEEQDDSAWTNALSYLENAHRRLMRIVSTLNDTDLERTVPGRDYTFSFMLHGAVRHNVYHAGQIGLLKRML